MTALTEPLAWYESKTIYPTENRIGQFDELLQIDGAVEIHRHLEGSLTTGDLQKIAERRGISMTGDEKQDELYWQGAAKSMAPTIKKDLNDFIVSLPTRYMRLLLTKAIIDGQDGHEILGDMMDIALAKAHREGISDMEMLVCPYALSIDGNLQPKEPRPLQIAPVDFRTSEPYTPAEIITMQTNHDIATQWFRSMHDIIARNEGNHIPDNESYLETFRKRVRDDAKYRWATDDNTQADGVMNVSLRFCIRRNEESEQIYKNAKRDEYWKDTAFPDLKAFAQAGLIVGVDIAGLENEYNPLSDFTQLFRYLSRDDINVPYTVHAGEIQPFLVKGPQLAFDNLYLAVMGDPAHGIKPARGIGHATMLVGYKGEEEFVSSLTGERMTMEALLERAIEREIPIHVNITCNEWTQVVVNGKTNPWIEAMKGRHPLFVVKPHLLDKLRKIVVITTDDPKVWQKNEDDLRPLAVEYARAYTDFATTRETHAVDVKTFTYLIRQNGKNALLHKKPVSQ